MLAILDNIRSSHNVGSIFRTADAAGVQKLYLAGITPGPRDRFGRENKRLTKVSLGAEQTVAWEHTASTIGAIKALKKKGYTILALEQSPNSISIFDKKLAKLKRAQSALVVGNEVTGLNQEILQAADLIMEIPMVGQKESLNAAVAFGVVAFLLGSC